MRILVISQHLFPMQSPRAHRTTQLVAELGRQGHEVTLYAVLGKYDYSEFEKKNNVHVKPIPLKWMVHPYNSDNDKRRTILDKVLGKLLKKLEFPNLEFMFRVPEILKNEKGFDLLITIADPHQIHWGVAKLRKSNPELVPKVWIADCGDPFMLNGGSEHLIYFEKYERLFCEQCDFITVPMEEAKQGYFEEYRHKIEVVPQGFDFEMEQDPVEPKNDIVTFAYAGVFYKDIRNPTKLLSFLNTIEQDFRFEVFSSDHSVIKSFQAILGPRLVLRQPLIREELIEELKKKDFLVNIENINSPAQKPSKLIDYAISGRPILSVNPENPDHRIIEQFLQCKYENRYIVDNIDQYHISRIAQQFIHISEK